MEDLAKVLKDQLHSEDDVKQALTSFNEKNSSNFNLSNDTPSKLEICEILLNVLDPQTQDVSWTPDTVSKGLTCLRIVCRGQTTLPLLCSPNTLSTIATLGDISYSHSSQVKKEYQNISDEETQVIVESVKCLCNIYLVNKHLVGGASDLGIVEGLTHRLFQYHTVPSLSHDLVFYDLRLLFLLTACDPTIRSLLRESHNGLNLMNSVIHTVLFNAHPQWTPFIHQEVPYMLQRTLTEQSLNTLCEALKILFNQTVHWSEDSQLTKEELDSFSQLMVYLRVLLLSLPVQISQTSVKTISHVAEVLVNQPKDSTDAFLLPPDFTVTCNLCTSYPNLYPSSESIDEEGIVSGVGTVFTTNMDQVFEGHNMAAIVCLLNYLYLRLCGASANYSALPPVITALRKLSKGNRIIRRFLKSKILPPLGKVTGRPEEGDDLRSKLVKLMTAAGGHGAEEVVADLLFVLCKENSSRLIKYTGYGNAAGLLMSRGLLGGGVSKGAADYSSDDDDSDTEEYIQSQPKIDEMTGGLVRENEPNPLDDMTEEEKEQEARKLNELIHRLNSHGIIKMMPLGPEATASNNTESDTSDCD